MYLKADVVFTAGSFINYIKPRISITTIALNSIAKVDLIFPTDFFRICLKIVQIFYIFSFEESRGSPLFVEEVWMVI